MNYSVEVEEEELAREWSVLQGIVSSVSEGTVRATAFSRSAIGVGMEVCRDSLFSMGCNTSLYYDRGTCRDVYFKNLNTAYRMCDIKSILGAHQVSGIRMYGTSSRGLPLYRYCRSNTRKFYSNLYSNLGRVLYGFSMLLVSDKSVYDATKLFVMHANKRSIYQEHLREADLYLYKLCYSIRYHSIKDSTTLDEVLNSFFFFGKFDEDRAPFFLGYFDRVVAGGLRNIFLQGAKQLAMVDTYISELNKLAADIADFCISSEMFYPLVQEFGRELVWLSLVSALYCFTDDLAKQISCVSLGDSDLLIFRALYRHIMSRLSSFYSICSDTDMWMSAGFRYEVTKCCGFLLNRFSFYNVSVSYLKHRMLGAGNDVFPAIFEARQRYKFLELTNDFGLARIYDARELDCCISDFFDFFIRHIEDHKQYMQDIVSESALISESLDTFVAIQKELYDGVHTYKSVLPNNMQNKLQDVVSCMRTGTCVQKVIDNRILNFNKYFSFVFNSFVKSDKKQGSSRLLANDKSFAFAVGRYYLFLFFMGLRESDLVFSGEDLKEVAFRLFLSTSSLHCNSFLGFAQFLPLYGTNDGSFNRRKHLDTFVDKLSPNRMLLHGWGRDQSLSKRILFDISRSTYDERFA